MTRARQLGILGCVVAAALTPGLAAAQSVGAAGSIRAAISQVSVASDARADPVGNGIAFGALSGAATGVAFMALMYATCDGCDAPARGPMFLAAAGVGGGIGAAVGWAIDAAIKKRPSQRVRVTGIVTPQRRAVSVAVKF